jgi:hypothetical protein
MNHAESTVIRSFHDDDRDACVALIMVKKLD